VPFEIWLLYNPQYLFLSSPSSPTSFVDTTLPFHTLSYLHNNIPSLDKSYYTHSQSYPISPSFSSSEYYFYYYYVVQLTGITTGVYEQETNYNIHKHYSKANFACVDDILRWWHSYYL